VERVVRNGGRICKRTADRPYRGDTGGDHASQQGMHKFTGLRGGEYKLGTEPTPNPCQTSLAEFAHKARKSLLWLHANPFTDPLWHEKCPAEKEINDGRGNRVALDFGELKRRRLM